MIFPEAVPPERLRRFGVGTEKLRQYPGLKEEYYLATSSPTRPSWTAWASTPTGWSSSSARRPTSPLYHRKSNPLFPQVLARAGNAEDVLRSRLPRTDAQREYVQALALPSVIVPDHAVDAQSLIALADLVVSAGAR